MEVLGLGLLILWMLFTAPRACDGASGSLYVVRENAELVGHAFLSLPTTSLVRCAILCHRHSRCLSFNHGGTDGMCQMNNARVEEYAGSLKTTAGFMYYGGLASDIEEPMLEASTETVQVSTETEEQRGDLGESTTVAAMSTELATIVTTDNEVASPSPVVTEPVPDTEAPVFTCPGTVRSYAAGTSGPARKTVVDWAPPTAVDNVADGNLTITCQNGQGMVVVSGDEFTVGLTTVSCEAVDTAGNRGECQFDVSVIGCDECYPLGMESGAIQDNQISAINVLNSSLDEYGPGLARLNGAKSWCGKTPAVPGDSRPWIEIEWPNANKDIYGLVVQGRPGTSTFKFVQTFAVAYREEDWVQLQKLAEEGSQTVFDCSKSGDEPAGHHVPFQSASRDYFRASVLRITARSYFGAYCMRFEIFGKDVDDEPDGGL